MNKKEEEKQPEKKGKSKALEYLESLPFRPHGIEW